MDEFLNEPQRRYPGRSEKKRRYEGQSSRRIDEGRTNLHRPHPQSPSGCRQRPSMRIASRTLGPGRSSQSAGTRQSRPSRTAGIPLQPGNSRMRARIVLPSRIAGVRVRRRDCDDLRPSNDQDFRGQPRPRDGSGIADVLSAGQIDRFADMRARPRRPIGRCRIVVIDAGTRRSRRIAPTRTASRQRRLEKVRSRRCLRASCHRAR